MIPGEIRRRQLTGSRRGDGVKTLRQKNRNRTSPGKRNSTEEVREADWRIESFRYQDRTHSRCNSLPVSCYFFIIWLQTKEERYGRKENASV